jgi:hypothetical protein
MEKSTAILIGMAALGLTTVAAFAIHRWRQKKRRHQVGRWVKDYLCVRYGELPDRLSINCSDDSLWPVLVAFDAPRTGIRHNLQFTCDGTHSTFALLSEKEEKRKNRPSREGDADAEPIQSHCV